MNIRVANADELNSIAARLHDARFAPPDIVFDERAGIFSLKCWIFMHRSQWRECQILFESVIDCEIKVFEKVRYYELATIRFSKQTQNLELIAHYGIEVKLTVNGLNGTYSETGGSREVWP
jgi:hypothetical protein